MRGEAEGILTGEDSKKQPCSQEVCSDKMQIIALLCNLMYLPRDRGMYVGKTLVRAKIS